MQIDSVASSHRLIADVGSSAQITGLFDDISYGKVNSYAYYYFYYFVHIN